MVPRWTIETPEMPLLVLLIVYFYDSHRASRVTIVNQSEGCLWGSRKSLEVTWSSKRSRLNIFFGFFYRKSIVNEFSLYFCTVNAWFPNELVIVLWLFLSQSFSLSRALIFRKCVTLPTGLWFQDRSGDNMGPRAHMFVLSRRPLQPLKHTFLGQTRSKDLLTGSTFPYCECASISSRDDRSSTFFCSRIPWIRAV